ncbi:glycerophosphodiester phosphodiesterase [Aliidiomarina minuta]|uniref:glycerophosphodiester phosphodiesterase n=1 Tax=Aliidiomarina minuta TaxID=880057 RepID=A0A432W408_9GAMM|nr:glycerophosphodiester phosphodiesterase family protein [Aliidiomarina minuta]RUO24077.1 glycerophosphodiester phosphodiesterase [Aliidiomarina minuta]
MIVALYIGLMLSTASEATVARDVAIQFGDRPFYLLDQLPPGALQQRLENCDLSELEAQNFSIAHRGAPLFYPEHSKASYLAAVRSGAGIIECDVTFTKDHELVCRHAQCDLHQTTDILLRPEIAPACSQPFTPASEGKPATASCCASDISLQQYQQLCARMDGVDPQATNVEDYIQGTPEWRTELYGHCEQVMTHADSIALIDSYGLKMTPELKEPELTMPFSGFSREDFADKIIEEYTAAGVSPERVYLQSFHLEDILCWIETAPDFARQAVWLDGRYTLQDFDPGQADSWRPSMSELKEQGVNIIGPPLWMLVTERDGQVVPSEYARKAKAAGLEIITWTLERSGPLDQGGGWYYLSIQQLTNSDAMVLQLLDVLANDVGVLGVFSDWPATTSFFSHCNE